MKRFTEHIKETFNEVKPGNQLLKTGVTNHYTPIQNILTNINNLFCLTLGIVASVGEDNVSIKLSSSQFTSQQKTQELLWRSLYNDVFTYGTSSLQGYITAQGLPKVTMINLGGYFVVYFSPDDMPPIANGCNDGCCGKCECPCPCEANECLYDEFEYTRIYEGDDQNQDDQNQDDDNQNQDIDGAKHKEDPKPNEVSIDDVLNNEDKVKAAKQLEILISQAVNLPREFYCAAIKFKNDDEAIALRWKYEKKLPTGKSTENTRSLIHIFTGEDKKIWVQDYAKDSIVELPKEVQTLIENVLKFLKAEKTEDPAVFTLGKSSDDNNDKDNNDNNSDDNNSENNNTDNQEDKKSNSKDNKEKDNKGGDLL